MTTQILTFLMFSLAFLSCDFRKSIQKDLITGLITKGDGLSCEEVVLTVDEKKVVETTFIYGQLLDFHFNNMEGFLKENESAFPGMILYVKDEEGDTIFKTDDMYGGYTEGINLTPLTLTAQLTVGSPMHSNHNYTAFLYIWDKKEEGTFTAELSFSIIENEKISVEKTDISYEEIYMYSVDRDVAVTDGLVSFDETVYLIFEGLAGFTEINGSVFPGLKFRATDNSGTVVMDYPDLFSSYTESGLNAEEFKTQIFVTLKFSQGIADNPIHTETIIFDKKSNSNIRATTDVSVN